MNANILAQWLRRRGYGVVRTDSTYWYNVAPRIYQAVPYHCLIQPPDSELARLFGPHAATGLRYSAPPQWGHGHVSYHVVCSRPDYRLSGLSKKARYDVRKGLRFASVEPIPFSRLATEGWLLRADTLSRQGRAGAEKRTWWERLCVSAEGLPGFEAWGAIHEGQLVASLLAFTVEDCCSILYQQSLTAHLSMGPNNALTYTFTREALGRPSVAHIFYGLHSLDAPPSVDQFKFRMGYTAKPVRQHVVFHPWLAPLFSRASRTLIRRLLLWRPSNSSLAKAEGMMGFYLEGKRPPSEQTIPQPLVGLPLDLFEGKGQVTGSLSGGNETKSSLQP